MQSKTYFRIFLLILVASISLAFFSYSHKTSSDKEDTNGHEKCCQKKAQSEFILWESLSRSLLSASR